MPFNQQMSIPCELTLRTFSEGIRLCHVPVKKIKNLRGKRYSWKDVPLKPGQNPLCGIAGELLEIQSEIELGKARKVGFTLRGNPLAYNVREKTLSCKDQKVSLTSVDKKIKLHILIDRTSIEIFANDGRVSMFFCFPLDPCNTLLEIFARRGQANIKTLNVWKLKSIWH